MIQTKNRLSKRNSDRIHLLLLGIMLIGLVGSKFLISISMMLCVLNLILAADFKEYWQRIKENRLAHLIIAFYLLHVISLLWSTNLSYGLNDLRIKAPLLVIPIILIAKPISRVKQNWLYLLLLLSLLITSIINFCYFQFALRSNKVIDIRELSLFGSHIRYGILLAMGFAACVFLYLEQKRHRFIYFFIGVWFIFYTYYSQVLSGLLALLVVIVIIGLLRLRNSRWVLLSALLVGSVAAISMGIFVFKPKSLVPTKPYNSKEIGLAWKKRSLFIFDSLDLKKQVLKITLMRYLDSKDLPRTALGVEQLEDKDIRNIENGYADVHETGFGLLARLYGIRYQMQHPNNPNGHSLLQRVEAWKTAAEISKEHWLIGVGIGDVADEFEKKYAANKSLLINENRIRAHNSYLTFCLSLGIFGFFLFIYLQIAFFKEQFEEMNYLGILFICIAAVSFLLEDTLETQTGVSFFAFFYGLYATKKTRLNAN